MYLEEYEVNPVTGLRIRPPVKTRKREATRKKDNVKSRLVSMMKRAEAMGLGFDLDAEWMEQKLSLAACEVTGIPFSGSGSDAFALSIDREDSSVGYLKSNCRAVVWIYNNAKGKFTHDELMVLIRALS